MSDIKCDNVVKTLLTKMITSFLGTELFAPSVSIMAGFPNFAIIINHMDLQTMAKALSFLSHFNAI